MHSFSHHATFHILDTNQSVETMESARIMWAPDQSLKEGSNLQHYRQWLKQHHDLSFEDYGSMWKWSCDHIEDFWYSLWQYFGVDKSYVPRSILSHGIMPDVKWFAGAKLNYAEMVFRRSTDQRPALIFTNESGVYKEISWAELEQKVYALKKYLEEQGITRGDRVAGYITNSPNAIISFLAVNAIGAVWTCCSPDFMPATVIERFTSTQPKAFIAGDGYVFKGRNFSRVEALLQIKSQLNIEVAVSINEIDATDALTKAGFVSLEEIFSNASAGTLSFEKVPFDHPIWVLYSSGTTGKPKAITHGHGGMLLEHLKYLYLHNDVKEGERFFWFTTTGWMMWNFLQASLLVGAIPVLYDGSPNYPTLDVLWKMASKVQVNHFGASAPYYHACMKAGLTPHKTWSLEHIRTLGSTGAPLASEVYDWVYQTFDSKIWLSSISGGTDMCTAFVGGNPLLPVRRGHIQCRTLGCSLHAFDDEGSAISKGLGEMVIDKPMPCMPIYFWNDAGKERYRSSYFEKYPGKWRHGDWIEIFDDGSLIITGRSDATLNRNGIRIGTAEIYEALDHIGEIKDALVINLERPEGDWMPLFVVLNEGAELDDELKKKITSHLRSNCSPRHVPDQVFLVDDVPYTLSGKKMEVPVKRILQKSEGKSVKPESARNPEALTYFEEFAGQLPK